MLDNPILRSVRDELLSEAKLSPGLLMPHERGSVQHMTPKEYRPAGIVVPAPWRVRAVSVLQGYRLSVTCNDGTSGVVDMSRLVASERAGIFAALKDEKLFNQVGIEFGALTWPNGADLDPA